MRSGHLLFSAVQFLFTVLILLIGGFFLGLHSAPHLRMAIGQFFINHSEHFFPIGLSILGCGMLLLIGFYTMNRGAYFRFLIPESHTAVDAPLFRTCVNKYWTDQFPDSELSTDVILHKDRKMEISLEMPSVEIQNQELFLKKIEDDLRALLTQTLGYRGDFFLTLYHNRPQSWNLGRVKAPAVQR